MYEYAVYVYVIYTGHNEFRPTYRPPNDNFVEYMILVIKNLTHVNIRSKSINTINSPDADVDSQPIGYYLHGPLARYVKLRVAHAPRMPGTFSPLPRVNVADMHHGTCVTHVPWCMPESLTSSFLGNRWREIRFRHSRRMHNPQFCVSGKRPMATYRWNILTFIIAAS